MPSYLLLLLLCYSSLWKLFALFFSLQSISINKLTYDFLPIYLVKSADPIESCIYPRSFIDIKLRVGNEKRFFLCSVLSVVENYSYKMGVLSSIISLEEGIT